MRILLTGDCHGTVGRWRQIVNSNEFDISINLGDYGFEEEYDYFIKHSKENDYILPGNHDYFPLINSDKCPSNILKKYGYIKEYDLFYVSGADSIDKEWRTEGIDWFRDEELSILELNDMINLYEKVKPKYVITHTCPESIITPLFKMLSIYPSRTGQALDTLLSIHKPEKWIFGHFHESVSKNILGTEFICLNEMEKYFLEYEI